MRLEEFIFLLFLPASQLSILPILSDIRLGELIIVLPKLHSYQFSQTLLDIFDILQHSVCIPFITLFVKSMKSLTVMKRRQSVNRYIKGSLQILERKCYRGTETSSLYSQNCLIFIHEIPVVENHLTTEEIRDLLRPKSTLMGNTVYF